jgi:hypothetical protein
MDSSGLSADLTTGWRGSSSWGWRMNLSSVLFLARAAAVWLGVAAAVMGIQIAHGALSFVTRHGQAPPLLLLMTLLFGGASVIGLVGAAALWRTQQVGRVACILSGAALIIGVGPAAILRGQGRVLALLSLTFAAVLWLASKPVARLCREGH